MKRPILFLVFVLVIRSMLAQQFTTPPKKTETQEKKSFPVKPASKKVVAEEVQIFGSIDLNTEFTGSLYLDGEFIRKVNAGSRYTLKDITVGTHIIKIAGNETWEGTATVEPNVIFNVVAKKNESLERLNAALSAIKSAEEAKKADEKAWKIAQLANTKEGYGLYLKNYPQGINVKTASQKIDEFDWEITVKVNSKEAYQKYLDKYPYGSYVPTARKKVAEFETEEKMRIYPDKYFDDACKSCNVELVEKLLSYGARFKYNVLGVTKEHDNDVWFYDISYEPISFFITQCTELDDVQKIRLINLYVINNSSDKSIFEHPIKTIILNPEYTFMPCLNGCHIYLGEFLLSRLDQKNYPFIFQILKLCIENGMNVNQDNGMILWNLTQMHSDSFNCYDMIEYVLKKGADPNLEKILKFKGVSGTSYKSALKMAKKGNKTDLVDLFKKYM